MKGLPLQCAIGATRCPLSFLFSGLNIPSCLSLSSQVKCFSTSDHLGGLPWAHASVSMSLVLGRPSSDTALQMWTLRCQMEGVTSHHHSCCSSPGCCWPPLPQGRIAYSSSTRCPPAHQRPFPQSCFLAREPNFYYCARPYRKREIAVHFKE